jgi:hypothetical protein
MGRGGDGEGRGRRGKGEGGGRGRYSTPETTTAAYVAWVATFMMDRVPLLSSPHSKSSALLVRKKKAFSLSQLAKRLKT